MTSKAPNTGDKSATSEQKATTTAHLVETTAHHLAHTKRHLTKLKKAVKSPDSALDHEHAETHLDGGIEHVQKLMNHIKSNYPAEGKELGKLEDSIPRSAVMQRIHKAVKKHK